MLLSALAMTVVGPRLQSVFQSLERSSGGTLGVAVELVETGERHSYRGRERFPTQSVFKVPISLAVLATGISPDRIMRVPKEALVPRLHSPIRDHFPQGHGFRVGELIRYAIEESDGTASDVLVGLAGGPAAVTRYLRSIGVKDFTVATTERQQLANDSVQYRNWSTPEGCLDLLRALQKDTRITAASRRRILEHMVATKTFPGRIKGQLPLGTIVAHKTGSSGTSRGLTRVTNDVGIVTLPDGRHLLVAVLLRDSLAADEERDRAIASAAKAAWDHFAGTNRH